MAEMRRKRQRLSRDRCRRILRDSTHGVLALRNIDGEPYSLPISYFYDGKDIYFHCAKEGRKLDIIRRNDKASFCVVAMDSPVEEKFTTLYKSVIVSGKMEIITDERQMKGLIYPLAAKYSPSQSEDRINREIEKEMDRLCMLRLKTGSISGKQAKELIEK